MFRISIKIFAGIDSISLKQDKDEKKSWWNERVTWGNKTNVRYAIINDKDIFQNLAEVE